MGVQVPLRPPEVWHRRVIVETVGVGGIEVALASGQGRTGRPRGSPRCRNQVQRAGCRRQAFGRRSPSAEDGRRSWSALWAVILYSMLLSSVDGGRGGVLVVGDVLTPVSHGALIASAICR